MLLRGPQLAARSSKQPGASSAVPGAKQFSPAEAEEVRRRTRQALLALGMLVSGTANTLTCKAALSQVSEGALFDHPFVMAGCMFCGEILCLLWFEATRWWKAWKRGGMPTARPQVPKLLFALPAMCDIMGTSVMYVGLTMTTASTYQMLRGSVIIFTCASLGTRTRSVAAARR